MQEKKRVLPEKFCASSLIEGNFVFDFHRGTILFPKRLSIPTPFLFPCSDITSVWHDAEFLVHSTICVANHYLTVAVHLCKNPFR